MRRPALGRKVRRGLSAAAWIAERDAADPSPVLYDREDVRAAVRYIRDLLEWKQDRERKAGAQ